MRKPAKIKVQKIKSTPLAVIEISNFVCILVREDSKSRSLLHLSWSKDGLNFSQDKKVVTIKISSSKLEKIKDCDHFSLSRTGSGLVMTYVRKEKTKKVLVVARSTDMYTWSVKSELPADKIEHTSIIYDKERDWFHLYQDGLFIREQSSRTLTVWKNSPILLFTSRVGQFDQGQLKILGSIITSRGVLLVYDASIKEEKQTLLQAGAVLFDLNDPTKILWRGGMPIWQGVVEMSKKSADIKPLGFVSLYDMFYIYWATLDGNLIVVNIPAIFEEVKGERKPKVLKRSAKNPIIQSRGEHEWEAEGTFNPAAFSDDGGKIHLLYRAIGEDGMNFDRLSFPVFEPTAGFEKLERSEDEGPAKYDPYYYASGGGWGGCEDPRVVSIEGRIYMTYVAFGGWHSIRIALTSISVSDFKKGRWRWKEPILLSPPGEMHKNWVLFPEKINGKFAVLHSVSPDILIDYVENFDDFKSDKYIPSRNPKGGREGHWDNLMRGAGPPPVKTKSGWLLLYHAMDKYDPNKYKLGAMILDLNDPTRVLYRANRPLLAPDMHYENNGKPGVIYASGAVIRNDDLYIYYGGADKVSCMASAPLKKVIDF